MAFKKPARLAFYLLAFAFVSAIACNLTAAQSQPNIEVKNYLSADRVQPGRGVQGIVEMEIPSGFHVHSSRPLEKFLIATQLQIEAPAGVRVGPVIYPRAVMRTLKFSKNRVSVYEGKAVMRFNVSVPAGSKTNSVELKARLRYQTCNDELCFPPQNRDITFSLQVGK